MESFLLRVVYDFIRIVRDSVRLWDAGSSRSAKIISRRRVNFPGVGLRPGYELWNFGAAIFIAGCYDQFPLRIARSPLGENLNHAVRRV